MEIILKRIYLKEDCTVGCLQILRAPSQPPRGEEIIDTIEPHAIAWEDKPLIGQKMGNLVKGKTAIPEGRYRVEIQYSKSYRRNLPILVDVPQFTSVVLRTGKQAKQTKGDIIVGHLAPPTIGHPADNPLITDSHHVLDDLVAQIAKAIKHGEEVWLTVRSPKGWINN